MALEPTTWTHVISQGFCFPEADRSRSLPESIIAATSALENHLLHSVAVREYLALFPKGLGTDCPDSPVEELVQYVACQIGMIDKSDPALTLRFLMRFIKPVFDFERMVVLKTIRPIISKQEWKLFKHCEALSRATDLLWAKWFAKIVVPYQSLDDAGRAAYKQLVQGTLGQYDYTVFEYDPSKGCVGRQTWAQAFPKEIRRITSILDTLAKTAPLPELSEYFYTLMKAYASTRIELLEDLWTKVDEVFIRIPKTAGIVPVHGMEIYEHPRGVGPEFRLEARTGEYQGMIAEKHDATLAHARVFGLSNHLIALAVQKLERIDIAIFVRAFRAGRALGCRTSGQAVPNRQEVLAQGGRIFLDKSAPGRIVGIYAEELRKHCSPATARILLPLFTPDAMRAGIVTHEYAHPIGRTPESDAAIGEGWELCEEAKATLLGILADEYQDPSGNHRLELISYTIPRILRFLHAKALENITIAPYVRENLAAATTLFESGVMRLGPEGVVVDVEVAQGTRWFDALRVFNQAVIDAYQKHDVAALDRIVARYCDKTHPQVAELIAWVNR